MKGEEYNALVKLDNLAHRDGDRCIVRASAGRGGDLWHLDESAGRAAGAPAHHHAAATRQRKCP